MSRKQFCSVLLLAILCLPRLLADNYEALFEKLEAKPKQTTPTPTPSITPQQQHKVPTSTTQRKADQSAQQLTDRKPSPLPSPGKTVAVHPPQQKRVTSFASFLEDAAKKYPELRGKPRFNPAQSTLVGWQELRKMDGRRPINIWFYGTLRYNDVISWSSESPFTAWLTDYGSHAATIITERRPDPRRPLVIPKSDPALVLATKRTPQGRIGAILYWPGH